MPSDRLYSLLANDAGVSAHAAARVYPLIMPQRPTLPAITYQRITASPREGSSTVRSVNRYQLSAWAGTYAAADGLASAIVAAVENWRDSAGAALLRGGRVVNMLDDYDPETRLFRKVIDVLLVTIGE